MTKRRKISEIYKDVEEINNWKPSDKDLEEISEVIQETNDGDEAPLERVAIANIIEGNINWNESSRV